ncbi:MAG: CRISPR-associated helicase Cas3' [Saprospiraceae bacterium]|nr:CRISPR-associated helicase Cas3' [Lewinella sp.]
MPVFYSHAKTDERGQRSGSKLLVDHTFGVLNKAKQRIYPGVQFPDLTSSELQEINKKICLLHDLGKYISYFQKYLLDQGYSTEEQQLKSHARFGAVCLLNHDWLADQKLAYIAYFVVLCHHRNLFTPDNGESDRLLNYDDREDLEANFKLQLETVLPHIAQIENELKFSGLEAELSFPSGKVISKWVKKWIRREPDIHHYFLVNYLFSLLIEGDKLDASDTAVRQARSLPPLAVDTFLNRKVRANNFQNRLRNQVRAEAVANLELPDILKKRLFLLTAPTGIGKTFTALDFALRMRNKLDHHPQIIVGLPFINIIEQTLDAYREVLPPGAAEILGHYQYADIFGNTSDNVSDEERDYSTRRMEMDTWQADIVVTSFVQLLQTMITNRNKLLLKFNHLAGAIVVMDEVQSIPLELVPLVGSVIYCMSRFLNTRFLLMTATKPLIFELADQHLLHPITKEVATEKVHHLLADPEAIFRQFERTQIIPHLGEKLENTVDFFPFFQKHWSDEKSCLVVCNTVNRSIEVFKLLSDQVGSNKNPVFYLSTNVLPLLRLGIIKEIRDMLKNGKQKPVLVATQVVEAGVDLDFDMGFRDLGPVDSIVQVAGRINRENSEARKLSPLHIFDFGDCHRIYDSLTDIQARKALGNHAIPEPEYFNLVEKYFMALGGRKAYDASRQFFKGILHLQYDLNSIDDTKSISQFRLIKDSPNVATVFVEWEENEDQEGTAARQAFVARLYARDRQEKFRLKENFDKDHKRAFHARTLAIPQKYCDGLPLIDPNHPNVIIYYVGPERMSEWYTKPIGFNRERSQIEVGESNLATQL